MFAISDTAVQRVGDEGDAGLYSRAEENGEDEGGAGSGQQ